MLCNNMINNAGMLLNMSQRFSCPGSLGNANISRFKSKMHSGCAKQLVFMCVFFIFLVCFLLFSFLNERKWLY